MTYKPVGFILVLNLLVLLPLLGGCAKPSVSINRIEYKTAGYGSASKLGTAVVRSARSQIGKPYKWGGSSPEEGFDCSGLVWWAYRVHGVKLPRVSWQQVKSGRPVRKEDCKAGDVVFFRIPGQAKSLHAGIYTGAGRRFIHSPKSGHSVREESMDKSYWQKYFIGARRFF